MPDLHARLHAAEDTAVRPDDSGGAVPSDQIAMFVWVVGAALMAVVLLKDLIVSLYRTAVGS